MTEIDFWDKFSAEYGNVYKFVLDFDDEGDRMILREEGYTAFKTKDLIESEKRRQAEQTSDGLPPLFTFPTWEDGSIVKMVGIAHTTTPHSIIYDTVRESLQ